MTFHRLFSAALLALTAPMAGSWTFTAETGPLGFSYNDAQIPNDSAGDRFDLMNLTGAGPVPYVRLNLEKTFGDHHTVRALYAPVSIEGTGELPEATDFAGETFAANSPVTARYTFNTYRFTYRYQFHQSPQWQLGAGVTALVRDANIRLEQNGTVADDPNLGFVPLLHFNAVRQFSNGWSGEFDIDTLASPQGRATDAALLARYQQNDWLRWRAGYRTLEGGGDAGRVYTFAWLHYGLLGVDVTW